MEPKNQRLQEVDSQVQFFKSGISNINWFFYHFLFLQIDTKQYTDYFYDCKSELIQSYKLLNNSISFGINIIPPTKTDKIAAIKTKAAPTSLAIFPMDVFQGL